MQTIIKVEHPERISALKQDFQMTFGTVPQRFFSAPGRTEICGNHTDHQRGCVLAAAVNLDALAAVAENGTELLRVQSEGYPMYTVELGKLEGKYHARPDPRRGGKVSGAGVQSPGTGYLRDLSGAARFRAQLLGGL